MTGYFPAGVWYDWYSGVPLTTSGQRNFNLPADLYHIPIHILGIAPFFFFFSRSAFS